MCRRQSDGAFAEHIDKNGAPYYLHWLIEPPADESEPIIAEQPTGGGPELADVETRDKVYNALLDALTLSHKHLDDLRRRGLSAEEITRRRYRTMPPRFQPRLAAAVHKKSGTALLLTVPGFFVNGQGRLSLSMLSGLVIPARNREGRIIALAIRPDERLEGSGKYLWVSSQGHRGPSAGAPAHVPLGTDGAGPVWRITEGVLKADIATVLSGVPTIGAAGAGNWRPCAAILKAAGCKTVRLAYDADAWEKENVGIALGQAHKGLKAAGFVVEIERWDPSAGKGIDDVLSAHGVVDVLSGDDAAGAVAEAVPKRLDPALVELPAEVRPLTDYGNAERLAGKYREIIRFCKPWKSWLFFDGRRWARDDVGQLERHAKSTARRILAEAALVDDKDERKEVARWAFASESRTRLEAMVALAQSEDAIPILPDAFDRDPWLFNCQNGTIDLRTGALRTHNRQDYITMLCPVVFDAAAKCPLWESTLELVFGGNSELIAYWQSLCGCVLTGIVTEQVLPILFGSGENGKSTILNALLRIMGTDYAKKAPQNFLMVRRHESHPTELADLFGKRLIVAIETGEGARINEVLMKELTGTDPITARRMRENFWTFEPTHKVMLCTNHKPIIKGTDHALWRRIHLIPFNVKIPAAKKDKRMPLRLAGEAPGILAWCVRGCVAWNRSKGLEPPPEVREATEAYRSDQNVIGRFLAECCTVVRGSDTVKARASALFLAFQKWAEEAAEPAHAMSQKVFSEKLVEMGFEKKQDNWMWFLGIGLRQQD
jgi:putative DNA primase/helicase